jgi:intein/homing endonuclease
VISSKLGRSKTTVYYHVRKNFGRRYLPLKFELEPNADLGEFLGAFASDGNFQSDKKSHHYRVTIVLSEDQAIYAEVLTDKMEKVLGKRPKVWSYPKQHTVRITIHGREILDFLKRFLFWTGNKTHTIAFRRKSLNLGDAFRLGIIRGLIAGDGSVNLKNARVEFAVTSKRLAKQYAEVLKSFGIGSHWHSSKKRMRRVPLHSVTVRGTRDLRALKARIGLTDPLRSNLLDKILERR